MIEIVVYVYILLLPVRVKDQLRITRKCDMHACTYPLCLYRSMKPNTWWVNDCLMNL